MIIRQRLNEKRSCADLLMDLQGNFVKLLSTPVKLDFFYYFEWRKIAFVVDLPNVYSKVETYKVLSLIHTLKGLHLRARHLFDLFFQSRCYEFDTSISPSNDAATKACLVNRLKRLFTQIKHLGPDSKFKVWKVHSMPIVYSGFSMTNECNKFEISLKKNVPTHECSRIIRPPLPLWKSWKRIEVLG